MAKYLITGVAGFIAARVAEFLLKDNHTVIGVDNLDDAYDVRMKDYRLQRLSERSGFAFQKMDISDRDAVEHLFKDRKSIDAVINLAASPFSHRKMEAKQSIFTGKAKRYGLPVLYCNQVGAQTELIFEGGSMAVNPS